MRGVDGPDEHCGPRDDPAVRELDAGQVIVVDDESFDYAAHDGDAACLELGFLGGGRVVGVGEVDDLVGPLAHELRVGALYAPRHAAPSA